MAPGQHECHSCRFCLGEEDSNGHSDFVDDPCLCRGTLKHVHLSCIAKHFVARGEWHNFDCPSCQHCYQGRALLQLSEISVDQMATEFGEETLEVAHSLSFLAQAHSQLGNTRECKELLERRLAIEEQELGIGHVATATTLSDIAAAVAKVGNISAQKEILERSLAINEAHFGGDHISTILILNNLAAAHNELGNLSNERDLLERSLGIVEQHFGIDHVYLTSTMVNLAACYSELGDAPKSCKLLKGALAIERQHFGEGHLETAITLNNLAFSCGEAGDLNEMIQHLERSLSIKERHYGKDHSESALTLANLGVAFSAMDDVSAAKEFINRALQACAREFPKSRRHAVVFFYAAIIHMYLGEAPLAEEFAIQAIQVLSDLMGSVAAVKVLNTEKSRVARILSVTGSDCLLSWLEIIWVPERFSNAERHAKQFSGEHHAEKHALISRRVP